MSVRTTADEKVDEARSHVGDAVKCLSEIVIDKCWGHDDFNEEFRKKVKSVFLQLLELQEEF